VIQEPSADPVSLSWDDGQSAATYELWANNLTTGQSAVIHVFDINSPTFSLQDHQHAGRYRAWVRGANAFGNGPWSQPVEYVIGSNTTPPETPQVLSPSGGTVDHAMTFTWTNTARAESYEIWLNSLTTGQSRVVHQRDLTTPSLTTAEPLAAGRYRVWVRAFNTAGNSRWSRGYNFSVSASLAPPSQPVLVDPGLNPQAVQWNTDETADNYEIWVNNMTTGKNAVVRQTGITRSEFRLPDTLDSGIHRAWIRASNAGGKSRWSRSVDFVVLTSSAGPPSAPSPTGVTQTDAAGHINMRWEDGAPDDSAASAGSYEVWITNLATGARVLHQSDISSTSFAPTETLPDGQFAAWVRASNERGVSDWSDRFEFEIGQAQPPENTTAEVTDGVLTVRMAENGGAGGSLVIGATAGRVYVGTAGYRNAYLRPNKGIRSLDIRQIRVIGSNQSDKINLVGVKRGPGAQKGHFDNLQKVIVFGRAGDDTIHGSAFDDQIYGEGGNDVVYGLKGDDLIYGGSDHDSLYGGADSDAIHGGFGNDTLGGTDTNHKDQVIDRLFGDGGYDWLVGFSDKDLHSGIERL
jgi:predicted phage tail protein